MTKQKPMQVLIVDDQYPIRELLQRQLEKIGHIVAGKASNGQQAIELTGTLQPDVVLMDIEMPKMDGLQATRKIMEKFPRPVVLLTSYDDPEIVRRASQAGAAAYLLKPPRAREIERQ